MPSPAIESATELTPIRHPLFHDTNFVMDPHGKITGVIMNYMTFQQLEDLLLDYGLGKAMEEVADDDALDLATAKQLAGFVP